MQRLRSILTSLLVASFGSPAHKLLVSEASSTAAAATAAAVAADVIVSRDMSSACRKTRQGHDRALLVKRDYSQD